MRIDHGLEHVVPVVRRFDLGLSQLDIPVIPDFRRVAGDLEDPPVVGQAVHLAFLIQEPLV